MRPTVSDGKAFASRDFLRRVGDPAQVYGFKDYTMNGGRARGLRAFDVRTGAGLEFTVLADRGLDIGALSLGSVNCAYLSPAGVAAPEFFEPEGQGFLRNFGAGFLTTCGLANVGSPGEDGGERLGLHGRISNAPAEAARAEIVERDGSPWIRVAGAMREARLFGENLCLERELLCPCGENRVFIRDVAVNRGFRPAPLMLLYHFNLGYPLLDAGCRFLAPVLATEPRDATAAAHPDDWSLFPEPTPGFAERVYYHDLAADGNGRTAAVLANDALKIAVAIRFDRNALGTLVQWKQAGEGEYVLGVEPANCRVQGRAESRAQGRLQTLAPGERREFRLEIELAAGEAGIGAFEREIDALMTARQS